MLCACASASSRFSNPLEPPAKVRVALFQGKPMSKILDAIEQFNDSYSTLLGAAAQDVLDAICSRIDGMDVADAYATQQTVADAADVLVDGQATLIRQQCEGLRSHPHFKLVEKIYDRLRRVCKDVSPKVVAGSFDVEGEHQQDTDTPRPRLMFVADAWMRDYEAAMQAEYEAHMRAEYDSYEREETMRAAREAEIRADLYGDGA